CPFGTSAERQNTTWYTRRPYRESGRDADRAADVLEAAAERERAEVGDRAILAEREVTHRHVLRYQHVTAQRTAVDRGDVAGQLRRRAAVRDLAAHAPAIRP